MKPFIPKESYEWAQKASEWERAQPLPPASFSWDFKSRLSAEYAEISRREAFDYGRRYGKWEAQIPLQDRAAAAKQEQNSDGAFNM